MDLSTCLIERRIGLSGIENGFWKSKELSCFEKTKKIPLWSSGMGCGNEVAEGAICR
jgi:hypothetical protein